MTASAFDIAERLQTPIIMLTDLDVGMNDCMSGPLKWDDSRTYDRGKVLDADQLDALEEYGRYLDVDGDAITYRTLPGTHPSKGAFFTRGTSRDEYARYTEKGDAYERNMHRLTRKWQNAPKYLPEPIVTGSDNPIGLICYGTSDASTREAMDQLSTAGFNVDLLRLRSVPFHDAVTEFIDSHEQIFVIEQNRDAQMRTVMISELNCLPTKLVSVLHFDGTPISADTISTQVQQHLSAAPQRQSA
jgi:2-oxoglutarate ferredoxin oxidoreductase subunit alpha